MTTEQLDAAHRAQPFRPLTLHLADGTSHDVSHPELLWRAPGGQTVIVSEGGEHTATLDPLLVTKITMGNGSNGRRKLPRRRQEGN